MEDLCDSLDNLLGVRTQNIPKEETLPEPSVSEDVTTIDHLISQLTGKRTDEMSNRNVEETQFGDGVILGSATNVDEILATDEALISPTSHNVSVLNVACQKVLKQIEYQLLMLLRKNRKEQEVIQSYLTTNFKGSYSDTVKKPSLKRTGMPYFKDTFGYQPPPNEDVLKKQKNNKLLPVDFINTFPVWNSIDAKNLINAVKQYKVLKPPSIDWLKISVIDLKGKYSASECKAKWTLHLNPSINRSKWTLKEMELLKDLSAKHNYQDWDKIASELGTNRNGLQCCTQYQTHTAPTEGKWTKQEDETLKKLVEKYKVKDGVPWKKVAWHFEDRSLKQCQERYAYHLGNNIKKGSFTMEEDFVIAYMASKLKNFGEVAKFLPNRVSTQVRARYEYLVETSMPKFSKEEDELLSRLMIQYPRNWGKISEHFKSRSRVQCRRRWAHLQRQINLDIDNDSESDEIGNSSPERGQSMKDNRQIDSRNVTKNIRFSLKPTKEPKKYPEIYRKLLDYHKYCHKFLFGPKPRIPTNAKELNNLTLKMVLTMKNLHVSRTAPLDRFNLDSLSDNCEFDKEDLAVLKGLKTSEQEGFESSEKIIPPNYMTLVGMRTFVLGWHAIQNLCTSSTDEARGSSEINSNDRILFSDAKKLFKTRMKTIFSFPIILSYISSGETQKFVPKQKCRRVSKPLSKRKRKEHAKLMSAAYRKKLKMMAKKFDISDEVQTVPESQSLESNPSGEGISERVQRAKKNGAKSEMSEENPGAKETRKRSKKIENEESVTPSKKSARQSTRTFNSA